MRWRRFSPIPAFIGRADVAEVTRSTLASHGSIDYFDGREPRFVMKELIMCYKSYTDSRRGMHEQRLASDETIEQRRREDLASSADEKSASESGISAMFRGLFASSPGKTESPAPQDGIRKETKETGELEKVD